ncbi:hypothetical protein Fot_11277 [Forsythia ovata]|uniref:Uncharacterized protein n=1 Tax=Forsythia ovata TaxID=205694 RepID=A0ABD1WJ76_9LAMI
MTVLQRSHLSENQFVLAFILMQDQNCMCEELSATSKRYGAEVDEYKKKVDDFSSSIERLEAEVERQTNELEELRKNPKVESLRADVHRFVNNLAASHGKQAGETELLELIKDEHTDFNFDFLYEEGETASLALPPEIDDSEAIVEPAASEAVMEPTLGALPSQAADSTV